MVELILIQAFILAFAAAVQSVVGFGLGLLAVPLLLYQGIPLTQAVFLVLSVSLLNAAIGSLRLRRELPWRTSGVASFYRVLGILPGLALAHATNQISSTSLKAAIGLTIGLGVLAQALKMRRGASSTQKTPSKALAPWAFLLSGLLMGWLGMGGPPLVFWLLTGRMTAKETRGFLFGVYLLTIPFQLALMAWSQPALTASLVPVLLVSLPLGILVSKLALSLGDRLSVHRLQWASLSLLTFLAVRSVTDWALSVWS